MLAGLVRSSYGQQRIYPHDVRTMTHFQRLLALSAALVLSQVTSAATASPCPRAGMTTPGGTFAYGYDGIGRSLSLTDPWSATTSWSYDTASRESGETLPNGITTVPTYNAADQLTRLVNANATPSTLSDFGGSGGVTHDGAGNTLSVPPSVTGVTALTRHQQLHAGQPQPAHRRVVDAQRRLLGGKRLRRSRQPNHAARDERPRLQRRQPAKYRHLRRQREPDDVQDGHYHLRQRQ